MKRKSKVLITGGAGFIGSSLANNLCKDFDVTAVDNLTAGDWSRINGSIKTVNFDFAKASFQEICDLISGNDYVYHLAAVKLHNEQNSNVSIIENNVSATNALIQACSLNQVKKILFTSSLYAYGHLFLPRIDEATPLDPKTVYGVSKLAGEGLLRAEAEKGGLEYVIARLFFIYGPSQFASGGYKSVIVSNFERLLQGEPAIVNGTGDQVLDYLYIDDCVEYLAGLMNSNFSGCVNVSSGEGISILDLVSQMIETAGSGTIQFAGEDWTSGSTRIGDNTLLLEMFPRMKKIPLKTGLENTLNDVRLRVGQV
jgi:UDP-glucose 4-epimerase